MNAIADVGSRLVSGESGWLKLGDTSMRNSKQIKLNITQKKRHKTKRGHIINHMTWVAFLYCPNQTPLDY